MVTTGNDDDDWFVLSCRYTVPEDLLLQVKQDGFSDRQVGQILGSSESAVRELRLKHGIKPWVKQVRIYRNAFYKDD